MQRPFYVIAHRVNDIGSIGRVISGGANAIECDIRYVGGRFIVSHDWTDFNSVGLVDYLQGMAVLARGDERLTLVIFDVKCNDDPNLAEHLLETIRTNLTDQVSISVLISVAEYNARQFLQPLACRLRENEAVAIDYDNYPTRVSDFFQSAPFPEDQRHAYGNGIDAFLPINLLAPNVPPSIMEAVAQKALAPNRLGIRFVYVWTLDDKDLMRDYFRMGVDGIMTNNVADLVAVVGEREFQMNVRLATRDDDPYHRSR